MINLDPPIWLQQWQARGGERFMSYAAFTGPKRQALAEGRLKLVRHAPPKPEPWMVEREAICQACPHRELKIKCGCALFPGAPPCYRRRPLAVCPDHPPRWGPA